MGRKFSCLAQIQWQRLRLRRPKGISQAGRCYRPHHFTTLARNKGGLHTFQEMSMTPLGFLVASTIANIVFVWLVYPKDEK